MIEVFAGLDAVETEWDALASRLDSPPFLYPGWFRGWWTAFGEGTLEVVVARRDGELAGVAPLYRAGPELRSASNWHTPEFAPVAVDDDAAAALAHALVFRGARRLSLAFLDPTAEFFAAATEEARRRGYRLLVRTLERCPFLALEPEPQLDTKLVRDLHRRRRRLDELGEVSVDVSGGRERLDELLEEGFAVEPSGWKGHTAIAASPPARAFYTTVARWAAERGWLRLAFLRLDRRPLAFAFALEDGAAWWFLKGGYDPEYARFAPGKLLVHAMIERAGANGLRRFEFLGSDEQWKLDFTPTVRELVHLQAFSSSPRGLLEWAAFAYGRPLAKRIPGVERAVIRLRRA